MRKRRGQLRISLSVICARSRVVFLNEPGRPQLKPRPRGECGCPFPADYAHWPYGFDAGDQTLLRCHASAFQPQRIILFGSHAYGKPDPDSDVDVLVVMPNSKSMERRASLRIREKISVDFPMDILARDPACGGAAA